MILDIHSLHHNIVFGSNSFTMNFSSSTIVGLVAILLSGANADNTPNLFTEDIGDLVKIKTSGASGMVTSNITVDGEEYNGDAEHFVMATKYSKYNIRVLVCLPETVQNGEKDSLHSFFL